MISIRSGTEEASKEEEERIDDQYQEREGPMYIPGGFDSGEPGPSKCPCTFLSN